MSPPALRSGPAGPYVASVMLDPDPHPTTHMPKTPAAPPRRGRPRKARPTRPRVKRPEKLTDPELIARAIAVSTAAETGAPITDREFAERILLCHPRTLRKYLEGRPLPALAREKLVQIVKEA